MADDHSLAAIAHAVRTGALLSHREIAENSPAAAVPEIRMATVSKFGELGIVMCNRAQENKTEELEIATHNWVQDKVIENQDIPTGEPNRLTAGLEMARGQAY